MHGLRMQLASTTRDRMDDVHRCPRSHRSVQTLQILDVLGRHKDVYERTDLAGLVTESERHAREPFLQRLDNIPDSARPHAHGALAADLLSKLVRNNDCNAVEGVLIA